MRDISTEVARHEGCILSRNLSLKSAWCPDEFQIARASEATSNASLQALSTSLLGGGNQGLKRAHLLPNSSRCAIIWDTLVKVLLGK